MANPKPCPDGIRTTGIVKYDEEAGVGINTTNPQAALHVVSTESGVLDPRVTEAQRDAMTVGAAQNGMRVFVTDGSNPGFYYYDHPSTTWKGIGGGDFIPRSGTTESNPVTGEIEFLEKAKNLWIKGADDDGYHAISFTEGLVSMQSLTSYGNTTFTIGAAGAALSASRPNSRGLVGAQDFTANITDLDYTQKKYVDDAIAASGGGSAVQSVSGNLVDNTDPLNPIVTGVASVTGTAVTGTSANPIVNKPVVTLGQVQSGAGYNLNTDTDPTGITLLTATSTPNVRDGLMSGTDKVAFDAAKAVNGIIRGNGSGGFTAATTTGSGSVVALQTSPGFLGAPTAPTAALYTNTTQLANTAFVNRATIGSRARIITDYNLPTVAANTPTKIFNIGVSNNGTWNLPAGEYEFFLQLNMSGLPSGASTISYVVSGTAAVSNVYMDASTAKSTSDATGTNTMSFGIFSTSATPISTSNTATFVRSQITGTFTVTTGGTYIPEIQGTGGFTTAVIRQGTRCVIRRIGDVGTYYTSDVD